ncbi:signal recognition particle-docking protein FtsY [Methanococcoides sp. NM1]|uniref:signal recognition particle-docking protein FtsY n=1 Tax=Methanococcoides sp. NM1 TaxID=1201013 RepID=UPI001083241C|nr:signal recognition particle-docking protein FtsY [Methanococcoides sp. NM1]
MFNKLKDKLSNFKQSIGKTIDEKAVDLEEPVIESVEVPAEELVAEPIEESVIPEEQTSTPEASITPAAQPEAKPSFKQKIGFAQKAKALVFEREVILDEDDIGDSLWELEIALLESDIAITVAEAIVEAVKVELVGSRKKIGSNTGELVEQALRTAIYNVMSANVFDLDEYIEKAEKPVHIVFIGVNGTGKTTTISKMAKRLKDMKYSVVIAAGDTFRAGAIDQIAIHAERIGVKLIKHQEGGDPAAVVYDAVEHAKANNVDVILSDTAGRMHTNVNLMAQLEKVCRVSTPDLIIFVDEAVAGNDAVERAEQFNAVVPIDGSILTKTDADSKGGAAISIAYITGKPILFLGMGQGYDDLIKFDPQWFVDQLFE